MLPFSSSLKGWAAGTAVGAGIGRLLGAGKGAAAKGAEEVGAKAAEGAGASLPQTVAAAPTSPAKWGVPEKNGILDRLGAPAGDLKAREGWLYNKPDPTKVVQYHEAEKAVSEEVRKLSKQVKFSQAPVKEAVKGTSIEEAKRIASEAKKAGWASQSRWRSQGCLEPGRSGIYKGGQEGRGSFQSRCAS